MKVVMYLVAVSVSAVAIGLPAGAEKINEQTPVQVRLAEEIKSGHNRKGDTVRFEVVSDVIGQGKQVLIPQGTSVIGTVTRSNGRGMFGRPGKLEFTIDYIKMSEATRVPLRTTAVGGKGRNNAAAAITTAVLLAPIAVFVKGREVKFEKGKEFTVFVDQTTELTPSVVASVPVIYDANRLSFIRFKDGTTLTGTVIELKNCVYTVATELGSLQVHQDKVQSVSEKNSETTK